MWQFEVPNAPYGVERLAYTHQSESYIGVPNAPCGVESIFSNISFAFDDKSS